MSPSFMTYSLPSERTRPFFPRKRGFRGSPYFICSGQMNCPCAKILTCVKILVHRMRGGQGKGPYTLKRKRTISPSFMTYSLPSERTRPFFPRKRGFRGSPYFICSGQMNCPCAKILTCVKILVHRMRGGQGKGPYTLKRKRTMSPSFMTYSLPSERTRPFSLAAFMEPLAFRSSKDTTSARMKPRSKSVWILPAA